MKWEEVRLDKIAKINMGQSPKSKFYNNEGNGLPFFQGKTEFGDYSPTVRQYTSKITKIAHKNDILFTVRAPVGELNITSEDSCIGRGLASIQAKNIKEQIFLYYLLKSNKETFTSKSTGAMIWQPYFIQILARL